MHFLGTSYRYTDNKVVKAQKVTGTGGRSNGGEGGGQLNTLNNKDLKYKNRMNNKNIKQSNLLRFKKKNNTSQKIHSKKQKDDYYQEPQIDGIWKED